MLSEATPVELLNSYLFIRRLLREAAQARDEATAALRECQSELEVYKDLYNGLGEIYVEQRKELEVEKKYSLELQDLVHNLIVEDPDEPIADNGATVLDKWRYDARKVLREKALKGGEDS
jgi:hypothetical protein